MSRLKKFLFKFYCAPSAPWIDWLRNAYGWNERFDFGDDIPFDNSDLERYLRSASLFQK
jgi:hypothetical protein